MDQHESVTYVFPLGTPWAKMLAVIEPREPSRMVCRTAAPLAPGVMDDIRARVRREGSCVWTRDVVCLYAAWLTGLVEDAADDDVLAHLAWLGIPVVGAG